MHVNNKHEVNLVVAHRVCIECVNKNQCPKTMCKNYVFYNNNYIVNNFLPTDSIPEILMNGGKLLVIKFMNVKIIDSINFIPMALAKMPKTFGLHELKKGYFPHFFNTPDICR